MSAACIPYSCRASARHTVDESSRRNCLIDYLQLMKYLFKVATISLDTHSTDVSEDFFQALSLHYEVTAVWCCRFTFPSRPSGMFPFN